MVLSNCTGLTLTDKINILNIVDVNKSSWKLDVIVVGFYILTCWSGITAELR